MQVYSTSDVGDRVESLNLAADTFEEQRILAAIIDAIQSGKTVHILDENLMDAETVFRFTTEGQI